MFLLPNLSNWTKIFPSLEIQPDPICLVQQLLLTTSQLRLLLVALFNTLPLIKSSSNKEAPIINMVQDLFENIDLDQFYY
jgi:hypothetical protein